MKVCSVFCHLALLDHCLSGIKIVDLTRSLIGTNDDNNSLDELLPVFQAKTAFHFEIKNRVSVSKQTIRGVI